MRFFLLCCTIAATLASCSRQDQADRFLLRQVDMPNGGKLYAEAAVEQVEMIRGLMFRDSMPQDRGMLFLHNKMGRYPYWMFQVRIPLDIIWLDKNKVVVEILSNVPPCPHTKASECPQHGGNQDAQFVLELNAGRAAYYGVQIGSKIDF
ncbi:MAG: DUF192 domain-containing protein [Acidobacteriota bacterium]|jgi:uncharacterized membrane protein (UPF0127 family)